MRWAFAEPQGRWAGGEGESHGTRYRLTRDGWHDSDLAGAPLYIDRLSSSLTQVAGYRRTICGVTEAAYWTWTSARHRACDRQQQIGDGRDQVGQGQAGWFRGIGGCFALRPPQGPCFTAASVASCRYRLNDRAPAALASPVATEARSRLMSAAALQPYGVLAPSLLKMSAATFHWPFMFRQTTTYLPMSLVGPWGPASDSR